MRSTSAERAAVKRLQPFIRKPMTWEARAWANMEKRMRTWPKPA